MFVGLGQDVKQENPKKSDNQGWDKAKSKNVGDLVKWVNEHLNAGIAADRNLSAQMQNCYRV